MRFAPEGMGLRYCNEARFIHTGCWSS